MRTKRIRSRTGLTALLAAGLAAVWLLGMGLLTRLGAEYHFELLYADQRTAIDNIALRGRLLELVTEEHFLEQSKTDPGLYHWWMLESLRGTSGLYSKYPDSIMKDSDAGIDSASVYLDGSGNLLVGNSDYIWFYYLPADRWEDPKLEPDSTYNLCGWIDLGTDKNTWPLLRNTYADLHALHGFRLMKFTGSFGDNGQFLPTAAWYVDDSAVWEAQDKKGPTSSYYDSDGSLVQRYDYGPRELILEGLIQWQPLYNNGGPGEVTIYAERPRMYVHTEAAPLRDGTGLYDLLLTEGRETLLNGTGYSAVRTERSLSELVFYQHNSYTDMTGWTYVPEHPDNPRPEPSFTLLTVTRSNPLWSAMIRLRWVYLWSGLATLALFFALRSRLMNRLVLPMEALAEAFDKKYEYLPPKNYGWQEPDAVYRGLSDMADTKRGQTNEIQRLKTALDYAKTAEEKRRQTTSALAHELKTPLAVVHSYAEGLQLGIAGEKTGFYLDTILRESEKMDALVMEMLDFSRLESGRVQIARDRVELGALTKGIFDKLLPLAAEKNLTVTLDWESEFFVTADEARIAQAVQNFASNAVKYTPEGGEITAALRKDRKEARLTVWNSLDAPLPEEVLTQVWEPFFRADESRTARGTGLGLAITKQIVTLHGGSVSARNMNNGIQFTMTLPL